MLMLAACGGSSSSGAGGGPETVTAGVAVGLTDATGAFAAYQVDITSLTLTRADGGTVEILPGKARVDIARHAHVTELLDAATLPVGSYTGAAITLDYGNADIRVADAAGDAAPVTAVRDGNGNVLTTVQIPVLMVNGDSFQVTPDATRHLTLDFDLPAANAVSFGPPVTMTVLPLVLAEVDPAKPKTCRLRGGVDSVDLQKGVFQVVLRPGQTKLPGGDTFGGLTVTVDGRTEYDLDGSVSQGGSGLDRLAALVSPSSSLPVVVRGTLSETTHRITATEVQADTSVPGYHGDAVTGTVGKRVGDTLTVRAATLMQADGSVEYDDAVDVQLASATPVVRMLSTAPAAAGDISVGQRITAFGTLSGAGSSAPTLDAGQGRVREGVSTLRGTVAKASPGFALALQSVGRLAPVALDFSGTGIDAAHDADAADYLIDTGGLAVSGIAQGSPVSVTGFVTAFGRAGGASPDDFTALSVDDLSSAPALLVATWRPSSAAAFETPDSAGLTLNLAGAGRFHFLDRGGEVTDLAPAAPAQPLVPVVQPPRSDLGIYSIRAGDGSIETFTDFADLVTALTGKLSGGAKVARVVARGTFDQTVSTLTAGFIRITLG